MRRPLLVATLMVAAVPGLLAAQSAPPEAMQLVAAVSPLPDSLKPGASVLGWRGGQLVTLRTGTNPMICLADDPAQEGFHAACYHRDLEPFMARGRQLRAEGVGRASLDSVRLAEVAAGRLKVPSGPVALYSVSMDGDFDPAVGLPANVRGLYAIYMPYATEASTGLSTLPLASGPWLMHPGLPTAHVMIPR